MLLGFIGIVISLSRFAVVVVRIIFKEMMMVFGDMREDKLETDFKDDERDNYADVGFDVDSPNEIDNRRG